MITPINGNAGFCTPPLTGNKPLYRGGYLLALWMIFSLILSGTVESVAQIPLAVNSEKSTQSATQKQGEQTTQNSEKPPYSPDYGNANPKYKIEITHVSTFSKEKLGVITIELFTNIAPLHVRNFDSLVYAGAFDHTVFHRLVPGFVIQGGDLRTASSETPREKWGRSAKGQRKIPAEFSETPFDRGVIGAARSEEESSNMSQFFICVEESHQLNNKYTAFGKVLSGIEVADAVVKLPSSENQIAMERIEMIVTRER
jgi:cyclophilin family peptidyl-prolyl cis-trans isomerase